MIEALLNGKYFDVLEELFISEKSDYLRLHSIILKDDIKEGGFGTKIMEDIIKYADNNNKIVVLTASNSYGSAKGRLIEFYKRFGFVPNKGRNKDYRFQDTMIREPKTMNEDKIKAIEESELPLIKRKIITKLREHTNIKIADESLESTIYFIFDGERPVGGVELSNVSGSPSDDTANMIDFRVAPKERPIKVITDVIPQIFRTIPSLNTILVPTNPKTRDFWERAGANRIKDGLHAFERGH